MLERIGRYRIVGKLGEGGMGVVYAAHDEDLDRPVALKLIREDQKDEQAGKRFRREARAAASVSHPNVCQLFEIREQDGMLFIAMELLAGETLAERIRRGALPMAEAVPFALAMLSALGALHAREILHRDLKPSNVFLSAHGLKLLDFGLARPMRASESNTEQTMSQITQAGTIVGTPRYMAPEQIEGGPLDARADLFAVAVILFEMLTGRHPFRGGTLIELLYAIAHEQPPALTGSPAIEALDRVLRRGLAKRPLDRHPTAAEMAQQLRGALLQESTGTQPQVRTMTRLIVLPFRCLRADPDIDFLAFSLPDAITAALSGIGSLVVRSSLAAAKFGSDAPDLLRIASEADVDAVLSGTLLRAGDELRVATQLVEAPAGTLLWSHTAQVTLTDVFQVQDDLVRRIVESLSVPLSAHDHKRLGRQLPATARAYELYLRANQLSREASSWELAKDLYERALEEDPEYAPAWARLGRLYRLLSKYGAPGADALLPKAEAAFRRALAIDPDLPLAHNLFAQFEVEAGRPKEVLLRLLERARTSRHDAELFAGLVHVCRYCGLLDASLAAERRARSLDPSVRTSAAYTYWMCGEYEKAVADGSDEGGFMGVYALVAEGRTDEAIRLVEKTADHVPPQMREFTFCYLAALRGERDVCRDKVRGILASSFRDAEGLYFLVRALAYIGCVDEALGLLRNVIEGGFFCYPAFARDSWLDSLRAEPRFGDLMRGAEARSRDAEVAFLQADGARLLA